MKSEVFPGVEKNSGLESADLLRNCARNLNDSVFWEEFYIRYKRKILLYLLRAFRMMGGHSEEFVRYADDWVQEVFTKLVQNDGRVIRSFRGTTENSVCAFLCSIALSVVADQLRSQRALRRRAQLTSLDDVESSEPSAGDTEARFAALLELIDVEKALRTDEESKNPERDLLIFKLHFVEGLSAREIASIPALKLTTSGLEKVLARVKNRLVRQQ
ncbi:MAG TPA: sigma-70 family RNA polymerase sigma factor [Terriglobia bacterium]|nr:sigma-70 family RNA polymerase sigma factor [Terriglobia bacterium]